MLNSSKQSRGRFGTNAEYYCASLFNMKKNPDGHRRPDLISISKTYSPKLTIELKSAKKGKGILVVDQLEFGLSKNLDYNKKLNSLIKTQSLFPNLEEVQEDIAFYYNSITRNDNLNSNELQTPFSAIKLIWGDQHIVPHEFIFNLFAISYSRRDDPQNLDVESKKDELKTMMANSIANNIARYKLRKKISKSNSWQNLESRMIRAIVLDDLKNSTKVDKITIKLLEKHYEEYSKLKKLIIDAPNNTNIYCLIQKEHSGLFEDQFSKQIKKNKEKIEELTIQRRDKIELVDSLPPIYGANGKIIHKYINGNLPILAQKHLDLSKEEILNLERLVKWKI